MKKLQYMLIALALLLAIPFGVTFFMLCEVYVKWLSGRLGL